MDWGDNAWIRLYTLDTPNWLMLDWQTQGFIPILMRKLDRQGVIPLGGRDPVDVVHMLTRWPKEVVKKCLSQLMWCPEGEEPTVWVEGGSLCMTSFLEAQNAKTSARIRMSEMRTRKRDKARGVPVEQLDITLEDVESPALEKHTESTGSVHAETTESTGSVSAQTTESTGSVSAQTTESTGSVVTQRNEESRTVTGRYAPVTGVTNRIELIARREREGVQSPEEGAQTAQTGAQAPLLSPFSGPSAPERKPAAPPGVERVLELLHTARKRLMPRARRTSLSAHTIELVLRPMRELDATTDDWERAIAGTYADVRNQGKDKQRFLSLDTLSKPANFRRALANADEHDVETLPADRSTRDARGDYERQMQAADERLAEESKARYRAEQAEARAHAARHPPVNPDDSGAHEAVRRPD